MMQPRMFASGGYDHAVHIWTADEDFSSATSSLLATKHNSLVQSILPLRDNSHKIITASADGLVTVWDLSSERVVNSFKVSNSVFHAHTTSLLFCTLLEVRLYRTVLGVETNTCYDYSGCPPGAPV